MGLAERRGLNAFQTDIFPALEQRFETATGFAVPITVAWDEIPTDGEAHLYADRSRDRAP